MRPTVKKALGLGLAFACVFMAQPASATTHFIGWQTFSNCTVANNNSGVCDTTPESNSTFDASPGTSTIGPANTYLTGAIGTDASSAGRKGRGQQTNNGFLNGDGFGNESANANRLIENITLADGSDGMRIGPFGSATQGAPDGTSSWKFAVSGNERTGDFRLTNESDFYFRLQFIHFDARRGNANSPQTVEIKYLSGDGTAFDNALTRLDNGNELVDLNTIFTSAFGPFVPGMQVNHVSFALGETGTQTYLAPGDSAGFRFLWSNFDPNSPFAESQIDNLAFEGTFFETAALLVEADPIGPAEIPILGPVLQWILGSLLLGLGVFKVRRQRRA